MPTSRFIQRFGDKIIGVLSGLDRLILHGTLRAIVTPYGMTGRLWHKRILLKQFGSWAQMMSQPLKQVSCQAATDQNRPSVEVRSAKTDKDQLARQIAAKDGVSSGLVAILTSVEPCMSFDIERRNGKRNWNWCVVSASVCSYITTGSLSSSDG